MLQIYIFADPKALQKGIENQSKSAQNNKRTIECLRYLNSMFHIISDTAYMLLEIKLILPRRTNNPQIFSHK